MNDIDKLRLYVMWASSKLITLGEEPYPKWWKEKTDSSHL